MAHYITSIGLSSVHEKKIIIYDNIICFCLQIIWNVRKTKHNIIFVWKLVKIVL